MHYHKISDEGRYSSILLYKGRLIKGGHWKDNGVLYFENMIVNSAVDTSPGGLRVYENLLFYSSAGKAYGFNLDQFQNNLILDGMMFDTYEKNTFLSGFDVDLNDWSRRLRLYQFNPYQLLLEFPIRYILGQCIRHNKKLIHTQNAKLIKSLSLVDGEYDWELDVVKELNISGLLHFEIVRLIGIVGINLWVSYKLDRRSGLLLVSIAEGIILWNSIESSFIDRYDGVKNIEERSSLFSLSSIYNRSDPKSFYLELEGETGKILREGFVESLFKEKLIITEWLYHQDKIYFTACREMMTTSYIGVLDYETFELLWYDEVPGRKGDLKNLQVFQNKLYVLDVFGLLHIFEQMDGDKPKLAIDELKKEIPKLSKFKSEISEVDLSHISFFSDYPFAVLALETAANYEYTVGTILASIEMLTGETIEILGYDYSDKENDLQIRYRILNSELLIDSRSDDFRIPGSILADVNAALAVHHISKRLKEFEPMPPDDYIILTYVDEYTYHRYGREGYGARDEYDWVEGKKWIGVW